MELIQYKKNEIDSQFKEIKNLSELVHLVEKEFYSKGKVICKIYVNDLLLSEEDEYRFKDLSIQDIEKFAINIESTSVLSEELIKNWLKSIPAMISLAESLSEKIRFEGIDNSLRGFADTIDACQYLVDSLSSLKILLDNQNLVDQDKWLRDEANLSKATMEIFKAFETKDSVLLADLMEYELINCLQNWQDWMKIIQDGHEKKNSESTDNSNSMG